MDEVRSPRLGVRFSATDRISAPVVPTSLMHRLFLNPLTVNLSVVGAVLIAAIGITLYIWRDVGVPAPDSPAPAASPQVLEIERLLGDLSFAPGTIDGVMDAGTTEAIRAFQQAAGLPEDGLPSPSLLDELRAVAGASN